MAWIAAASVTKTRAGPDVPIHVVLADQRWVDRGALDDRSLRRQIAHGKTDRRREPARPRAIGRHDHILGIDSVPLLQDAPQRRAPRALAPPVEACAQRFAAHGLHLHIQKPVRTQFQHHFGHAAGQKHLHRGKIARAVGQRIHKARHQAIDLNPIGHRGPRQARRMRNGRQMNEKVRRSAESRLHHHGVVNGRRREDVARRRCQADAAAESRGPSGVRRRARPAVRKAQAPYAAARVPALRPPPARLPRCPETGTLRRATRRRGSPPRPHTPA